MPHINVALDGPSGAGKSSIADALAERYGLHHLDTGAMYRAIAWDLNQKGIAPENGPVLDEALESIHLDVDPESGHVRIENVDVDDLIRTPEVSRLASLYSALPAVRKKLVALQQEIAKNKGYILDGRDICDVVLPDAEVKIYLDAAPEARAKRRMLQDQEKGKNIPYEQVLQAIIERDERDRSREATPLRVSKDAVLLDSSDLSFEQTVDAAAKLIDQAISSPADA